MLQKNFDTLKIDHVAAYLLKREIAGTFEHDDVVHSNQSLASVTPTHYGNVAATAMLLSKKELLLVMRRHLSENELES